MASDREHAGELSRGPVIWVQADRDQSFQTRYILNVLVPQKAIKFQYVKIFDIVSHVQGFWTSKVDGL